MAQSILGIVILFAVPSAIWYLISEVFVSAGEREDQAEIRYWEMAYADSIWETGQFDGTKAFLNNHMVSYGRKGRVSPRNYDEKGLYEAVQNVLVDGGYTGKPFAAAVQGILGASVEVVKRSELHTFVVLPKRWVVERSFAWLEKCRRLWKNCERKLNTSLQMVVLAFATLILRRL